MGYSLKREGAVSHVGHSFLSRIHFHIINTQENGSLVSVPPPRDPFGGEPALTSGSSALLLVHCGSE